MKYAKIFMIMVIAIGSLGCKKEDNIQPSANYIKPNDYLSDKKYKTLIVEVNYIDGYQPTDEAIKNMKNFLIERLNKPKGIKIGWNKIASPRKTSYSVNDIKALEKSTRKHYPMGDILVMHVLFLDNGYVYDTDNTKYLGIAYGPTSMAIFQKTVADYSGGLGQPSNEMLETTIINHEIGHLLGLVNNGTPMLNHHQDKAHGNHCNDENCLMYYATETTDIIGNLLGNNIPQLDQHCINDLRGNGGK